MTSHKHKIVGKKKLVWDHTSFLPAIHDQLPCVPFEISWFQFRSSLIFLKFEHFLSPQSNATIDPMISAILLDRRLRYSSFCMHSQISTIYGCMPSLQIHIFGPLLDFSLRKAELHAHFLLEHFHPKLMDFHHTSLWIRWSIYSFTIWASRVSNSCTLIPLGVISLKDDGFSPCVPLDLIV